MSLKTVDHGIHCLPFSQTNDVIDPLPKQLLRRIDFTMTSLGCNSAKVLKKTIGNSIVAIVLDL